MPLLPPPPQYANYDVLHMTREEEKQEGVRSVCAAEDDEKQESGKKEGGKKLTLLPLIFLIYFEVAGGPFGEEPAVKAAGPLLAILGFLIFPFIWSIPEALITAELSTTYPGNGGFVIWADRAFGPFAGSFMGFTKFLSGVINTASFPLLCISYLQNLFPSLSSSGLPRTLSLLLSTSLLSFLNFTGLTVVGYTSLALALLSLSPFLLLSVFAIKHLHPRRWLRPGRRPHDWTLFFNTLFWNLNFWDNVSTVAGEVDDPQKNFPKALLSAVILTCTAYVVPLLVVVGAVEVGQERWESGFFAEAGGMVGGRWLKVWVEVGAVLSAVGLYEAQMSSCSFGLLGMAELGFVPKVFERRSRWFNTPWVGILVGTVIAGGVSCMEFTDVISSANFMYSMGMLLEFGCFLWLRRRSESGEREGVEGGYVVPVRMPWVVVMCLVPSVFLVYVMVIATRVVFFMSGVMTAAVVCMYFLMNQCRSRGWMSFNDDARNSKEW